MDQYTPGRAALLFFASFLILMVILPLLYSNGSFTGLDGRPGVIENLDRTAFADPLTRAVYALGDLFCHQEEGRSFIVNGSQTAFCQRDMSILVGVVAGLIVTDRVVGRVRTGSKLCLTFGILMVASTIAEWAVEYLSGADILAAR
ncbi:MAG: DUF2085 domain-containing protein, partial [Candidatus Methanoplasma sp.]|nr:DUF2085 domain-containing protein [Candidatus Methanoplasma sp.]